MTVLAHLYVLIIRYGFIYQFKNFVSQNIKEFKKLIRFYQIEVKHNNVDSWKQKYSKINAMLFNLISAKLSKYQKRSNYHCQIILNYSNHLYFMKYISWHWKINYISHLISLEEGLGIFLSSNLLLLSIAYIFMFIVCFHLGFFVYSLILIAFSSFYSLCKNMHKYPQPMQSKIYKFLQLCQPKLLLLTHNIEKFML